MPGRAAVLIAVGAAYRELFSITQDVRCGHIIRQVADVYFCRDELHRNIVAHAVDGDGGILAYLARDAVVKAVVQPLAGLRFPRMIFGSLVTIQRDRVDAAMKSSVVRTHIITQHFVELCKRGDGIYVERI
jgi:hypothetical protein